MTIHAIDDDDEFDWEEAVRAIDVACETSIPSTSACLSESSLSAPFKNYKPCASRQTTLDQFVGVKTKIKTLEKASPSKCEYIHSNEHGEVCAINIDAESAQTWIYPVNGKVPHRDYQFSISQTALFSNTLVALPTGLGKTFIAAVVMYNYFRWFPEGKIVFAAPSRPLVMQQIEACHNIVGIPQGMTIDMTGEICGGKRSLLWKTKRVFFVTPQVLENDIQSGICLIKYLVCLVIDEAHRALGNQSCSVAVRELMDARINMRILALTATPGSKRETIQQIIDNLRISTLEYRTESDHDVNQYVHNKEIELMKVSMGQNVVEISDLLLEMIRPFANKLHGMGVLTNQDPQLLTSAYILLKYRDKFRQAPPQELPPQKHGEVESYFGILLSLSHICKLLSGHGIRSAHEMLEERMQNGFFAKFMNKNEALWKVKLLMEQSLSCEAPYPKLIKLLEVLTDHFKFHGPKDSRAIIFSNFRRSVRDIMDALAKTGESIKAAQFIGQNSGKSSKGQSRKDQQAVLEKFRAGVYNVIVATSIAEEGLDIVEVDLVICFDANISSLRMIQRMGRTGRKNDGRVVVLACEGTELKGYMNKQALGKAVGKHMHNGGMNSFNFHPSPRMIPHVFKPEVQLVEMSIQPYIPRGKITMKDDCEPIQNSRFKEKPCHEKKELLAKIFNSSLENKRKPSLIAFPHFQAFPSGIHNVNHSFKTGMLIDAMQHLDGLSFGEFSRSCPLENETSSCNCLGPEIVDGHDNKTEQSTVINISKDPSCKDNSSLDFQPVRDINCEVSSPNSVVIKRDSTNISEDAPSHSNLFGSEVILVNAMGEVVIPSVPQFPLKEGECGKIPAIEPCANNPTFETSRSMNTDSQEMKVFDASEELLHSPIPIKNPFNEDHNTFVMVDSETIAPILLDDECDNSEQPFHSPILKRNPGNEEDNTSVMVDSRSVAPILLDDECGIQFIDKELSPRLTSLIKNGVVPESPINDAGHGTEEVVSSSLKYTEPVMTTPINDAGHGKKEVISSPVNHTEFVMKTPITDKTGGGSVGGENYISLANSSNTSCSRDWQMGFGEKSEGVHNFKRLRKYGGSCKRKLLESLDKIVVQKQTSDQIIPRHKKHTIGKKKPSSDVRIFIEEEAEVSCEVEVSSDEEVTPENKCSSVNSFLDDRSNATPLTVTQPVTSTFDMMAVYRRSLLSQSPIGWNSKHILGGSPDSMVSSLGRSSKGISDCTPDTAITESASLQIHPERDSLGSVTKENERGKRKLSIQQLQSIPSFKLPLSPRNQPDLSTCTDDAFAAAADDVFFEGIDLDEVEKHATLILRSKTGFLEKENKIPEPGEPSFSLGI